MHFALKSGAAGEGRGGLGLDFHELCSRSVPMNRKDSFRSLPMVCVGGSWVGFRIAGRVEIRRTATGEAGEEPRNGVAFFGSGEKGGARKLMRRASRLDRLPLQPLFTYVVLVSFKVLSVNI